MLSRSSACFLVALYNRGGFGQGEAGKSGAVQAGSTGKRWENIQTV